MSGGGSAQAVNTSVTLVHICQNLRFNFSFLENTYLSLVLVSTSGISIVTFWYIQRQWNIDSKKMARLQPFYYNSKRGLWMLIQSFFF
jgi:hypothetical protein